MLISTPTGVELVPSPTVPETICWDERASVRSAVRRCSIGFLEANPSQPTRLPGVMAFHGSPVPRRWQGRHAANAALWINQTPWTARRRLRHFQFRSASAPLPASMLRSLVLRLDESHRRASPRMIGQRTGYRLPLTFLWESLTPCGARHFGTIWCICVGRSGSRAIPVCCSSSAAEDLTLAVLEQSIALREAGRAALSQLSWIAPELPA